MEKKKLMSTKLQNINKRITRQIRVSTKTHRNLKFKAIKEDTTISKLADYIINGYLEKINKDSENVNLGNNKFLSKSVAKKTDKGHLINQNQPCEDFIRK